jgi:hypothetical protein
MKGAALVWQSTFSPNPWITLKSQNAPLERAGTNGQKGFFLRRSPVRKHGVLHFRRNAKTTMDPFSAVRPRREFIVSSFLHLSAESIIHNVKGALFDFIINAREVFAYEPDCDELNSPEK